MTSLTYEQTVELERAIKLKDEAYKIYCDFVKYAEFKADRFNGTGFVIWSDTHNSTILKISNGKMTFCCLFLHETYNIVISVDDIFEKLKINYRGIHHLVGAIENFKRSKEAK